MEIEKNAVESGLDLVKIKVKQNKRWKPNKLTGHKNNNTAIKEAS